MPKRLRPTTPTLASGLLATVSVRIRVRGVRSGACPLIRLSGDRYGADDHPLCGPSGKHRVARRFPVHGWFSGGLATPGGRTSTTGRTPSMAKTARSGYDPGTDACIGRSRWSLCLIDPEGTDRGARPHEDPHGPDLPRPARQHGPQDRLLARGVRRALLHLPRRRGDRDPRLAQGRAAAHRPGQRHAGGPDRR